MENKRSFGGLVRKVVAPVVIGAAALMPMAKPANAEMIYLTNTLNDHSISAPGVSLKHESGSSEWYDTKDTEYSNNDSPAVDFYSTVMKSAHSTEQVKLSLDSRDPASTSIYHTEMKGRGLPVTTPTTGELTFYVDAATSFGGKPIFADIYKNGSETPLETIDVRDYATNNKHVDISLSGTDFYDINVKFVPEPGTLSLLAMAGLAGAGVAAYNLSKRKK